MKSKPSESNSKLFSALLFDDYIFPIKEQIKDAKKDKYGNSKLSVKDITNKGIIVIQNKLLLHSDNNSASTISEPFNYAIDLAENGGTPDPKKEEACERLYFKLKSAEDAGYLIRVDGYLCAGALYPKKAKKERFKDDELSLSNNAFPNFDTEGVLKKFKLAKDEKLQILDTWLGDFFFDVDDNRGYSIDSLLKNNDKLVCQVLVLNPTGEAFSLRMKSMTSNEDTQVDSNKTIGKVIDNLSILYKLQIKYDTRLEVRLFDDLPCVNAFITSNDVFYGHYFAFASSKQTSFHRVGVEEKTLIGDEIQNHFDILWKRNETNTLTKSIEIDFQEKKYAIAALYRQVKDGNHYFQGYLPSNIFQKLGIECPNESASYAVSYFTVSREENSFLSVSCKFPDGVSVNGSIYVVHEKYYRCQFSHIEKKVVLNFVMPLNIGLDESDTAIFSLIGGKSAYCGLSVVYRNSSNTADESEIGNDVLVKIDKQVSELNKSFWIPAAIPPKSKSSIGKIAGNYRVFSYGRGEKHEIRIEINILKISESGFVQYIKKDGSVHAQGVASMDESNNLYLDLQEVASDLGCHFIFHTHGNGRKITADTLFFGLYLGISQTEHIPKAVRVVIKPIAEDEDLGQIVERIDIHTPRYRELSEGIRKALSGKIDNFLSWHDKSLTQTQFDAQVNQRKSFDLTNALVLAACYDVVMSNHKNESGLELKNLEKAFKQGFTNFLNFEKKIKDIDKRLNKLKNNSESDSSDNYYHSLLTKSEEYQNLLARYGFLREPK
jgi:hypothetical protein